MGVGQQLKMVPVFDPHEKYRKKDSKIIGRVEVICYDDGNPPILRFFGDPPASAVKRAQKDLFRRLTQSIVRKAATDDRARRNKDT